MTKIWLDKEFLIKVLKWPYSSDWDLTRYRILYLKYSNNLSQVTKSWLDIEFFILEYSNDLSQVTESWIYIESLLKYSNDFIQVTESWIYIELFT